MHVAARATQRPRGLRASRGPEDHAGPLKPGHPGECFREWSSFNLFHKYMNTLRGFTLAPYRGVEHSARAPAGTGRRSRKTSGFFVPLLRQLYCTAWRTSARTAGLLILLSGKVYFFPSHSSPLFYAPAVQSLAAVGSLSTSPVPYCLCVVPFRIAPNSGFDCEAAALQCCCKLQTVHEALREGGLAHTGG